MSLPPRDDPSRPLVLAARSVRWLGISLLLLGWLALCFVLGRIATGNTRDPAGAAVGAFVICFLLFLGPGSLYFLFGHFMFERRKWAAVAALVLASLQSLPAALIALQTLFYLPLLALLCGAIFCALIFLIVLIARSFPAIRPDSLPVGVGFEPILPAAADPAGPQRPVD